MMELYQAYGNYETMMDLTEGPHRRLRASGLVQQPILPFGEKTIDFTPPWQRARYADLFREHVGVAMDDVDGVRAKATAAQHSLGPEGRQGRHRDAERSRRAGSRTVRAQGRGQTGRAGVRLRLSRRSCVR